MRFNFFNKKKKEAVNDFNNRMNNFKEEDVESTAQDGESKFQGLTSSIPKPLVDLWEDIKLLINLLKDYYSKRYTEIPLKSIMAIGASIAYFVSPIDIMPDAIPIIGYLDDAMVLKLAMDFISKDLDKYREWLANNNKE